MENEFLKRLLDEFEYLNKVPKFQLERAISPLIGIFIKEIISKECNANVTSIIPEFPLKKKKGNQSTNIDWLLFDETAKTLYFVELKTDPFSYSVSQSKIYEGIKTRVKDEGATFLLTEINKIRAKSNRQEKYDAIINKFPITEDDLKDYKNLIIVYIAPLPPCNPQKHYYDKLLLFKNLPNALTGDFHTEWSQLVELFEKITAQSLKKIRYLSVKKQEGNIVVFKDLGLISDDPEEERRSNIELRDFLTSKGYPAPKIKRKVKD